MLAIGRPLSGKAEAYYTLGLIMQQVAGGYGESGNAGALLPLRALRCGATKESFLGISARISPSIHSAHLGQGAQVMPFYEWNVERCPAKEIASQKQYMRSFLGFFFVFI
jgi:hypothetical protein